MAQAQQVLGNSSLADILGENEVEDNAETEVESVETDLYEKLLDLIPAECLTVSLIVECLVEQVAVSEERRNGKYRDKENERSESEGESEGESSVNGITTYFKEFGTKKLNCSADELKTTIYLNSGDYASLRNCHLPRQLALNLSASHLRNEIKSFKNYLWESATEFNSNLWVKMLANLNHFMKYIPHGQLKFEDMFYIMHLLMAAGVEGELQSKSKAKDQVDLVADEDLCKDTSENKSSSSLSSSVVSQRSSKRSNSLPTIPEESDSPLSSANNYLVEESIGTSTTVQQANNGGIKFLLAPAAVGFNVLPIKENLTEAKEAGGDFRSILNPFSEHQNQDSKASLDSLNDLYDSKSEESSQKECGEKPSGKSLDSTSVLDENDNNIFHHDCSGGDWDKCKFDSGVIKNLLDCPPLKNLGENGALDLSQWSEEFLLTRGLSMVAGEGNIIGQIRNWNYIEELCPTTMTQALQDAASTHLCMERMYCPFYDTQLFIFNNPSPESLKYYKHFEYKLSTSIEGQGRGVKKNLVEFTISESDLMKLSKEIDNPENSDLLSNPYTSTTDSPADGPWVLIPSIRYADLKKDNDCPPTTTGTSTPTAEKDKWIFIPALKYEELKKKVNSPSPSFPVPVEDNFGENETSSASVKIKESPSSKSLRKKKKSRDEIVVDGESQSSVIISKSRSKKKIKKDSKQDLASTEGDSKAEESVKDDNSAVFCEEKIAQEKLFTCYNLATDKSEESLISDVSYLFPLDGSNISYEVTKINSQDPPKSRQLTISKNGHCAYFYPNISYSKDNLKNIQQDVILIPHFHTVLVNETTFSFTDTRINSDSNPYLKSKSEGSTRKNNFTYDNILFSDEVSRKLKNNPSECNASAKTDTDTKESMSNISFSSIDSSSQLSLSEDDLEELRSYLNDGGGGFGDSFVYKPSKSKVSLSKSNQDNQSTQSTNISVTNSNSNSNIDEFPGHLIRPMTHLFKIRCPSGLCIECEDIPSIISTRVIKQSYRAVGSSSPLAETSRHYTMNGNVIKFMSNGTIQILSARGSTTNIQEISTNSQRIEGQLRESFENCSDAQIFTGEKIYPSGEYWKILNGRRVKIDPLFVYSSGPMENGEIFHRRQDGVISLHRDDGLLIIHYPDGTRFTSRMIIQEDQDDEFQDFVFVGLKTIIEHPNYARVIFNSLSGNIHLQMPKGSWARVFASGIIRVGSQDQEQDFRLDVDSKNASFTFPPCPEASKIPNKIIVNLFHGVERTISQSQDQFVHKMSLGNGGSTSSKGSRSELSLAKSQSELSTRHSPKSHSRSSSIHHSSFDKFIEVEESIKNSRSNVVGSEILEKSSNSNSVSSVSTDFGSSQDIEIEWEILTATDSWNNKFFLDIFGNTQVLKSKGTKSANNESVQLLPLLPSFSPQLKNQQQNQPGILNSTSSSNILSTTTSSKMTSSCSSSNNNLSQCKIFVVKRDFSGFQFLSEFEVEKILMKARKCPETHIVRDSLRNTSRYNPRCKSQPRQTISIMEPSSESERAEGTWKCNYIQPIFRPKMLSNKHLRNVTGKIKELRWFSYILSTAYKRKPSFIQSPRKSYALQVKNHRRDSANLAQETRLLTVASDDDGDKKEKNSTTNVPAYDQNQNEIGIGINNTTAIAVSNTAELLLSESLTSVSVSETEIVKKKRRSKSKKDKLASTTIIMSSSEDLQVKKEKKKRRNSTTKLDKKESSAEDINNNISNSKADGESGESHQVIKKSSRKSTKSKSRKSKSDSSVITTSTSITSVSESMEKVEESQGQEEKKGGQTFDDGIDIAESRETFGLAGVPERYPSGIKDIKGIYEVEDMDEILVKTQHHSELNFDRKQPIILRKIIEIPRVGTSLQNALHEASISFAAVTGQQLEQFENFKILDPRSDEEKRSQKLDQKKLIEENLDEFHTLEQSAGKILEFHF